MSKPVAVNAICIDTLYTIAQAHIQRDIDIIDTQTRQTNNDNAIPIMISAVLCLFGFILLTGVLI